MQPVYLDYNATTPVAPEVLNAMIPYFMDHFGNPSSSHSYGRQARYGVDRARQQVAELLAADPFEIIFTGCATEANNIALFGLSRSAAPDKRHFVTSAIEHPSVLQPCLRLQQQGWKMSVVPVDAYGVVHPQAFEQCLQPDTAFASIMQANNEIGTVQPIEALSRITRVRNIPFHVDASQAVGKLKVHVREMGVDLLTVAGHKFYGPKGVGALYVRHGLNLHPLLFGADHEFGIRPGTENVASIIGLGEACRLAGVRLSSLGLVMMKRRDELHSLLLNSIPGLLLNGHPTERLPNTLNVSFPGVAARELLKLIDDEVAASLGSACHSPEGKASGTLAAINAGAEQAMGAIRFSVGILTTADDIRRAADAVVTGWMRLKRREACA